MSHSVRSSRPSRVSGALLLWLGLLIPGLARADVALVRADGSGDYPTIQAAIDAVPSGSEILLQSGVFSGVGNRALDLGTKVLTIRSIADDPDSCLIDCERAGRGIVVSGGQDSTTVLRGLRIENGFPADSTAGGAILLVSSSPRVENCVLAGNETLHHGGGLACFSASPLLRDLEVVGNLAQDGGGIYADSFSIPVVERSTFAANRGLRHGGGLYSDASDTLRITRTIFWGNCADSSAAELRVADVVQFICSDLDSAGVDGPGTPSFDANTIFSDPLFCAPSLCSAAPQSSGSFALQSGSPASAALSLCGATIGGGPEGCFVPTGACCFADGSCLILSAADCATASGTYQGDDTVCAPNPCPPPIPTGACCRSEGVCELLTDAACADSLGRYLGDASACEPNPCPTYYLKADGSGDFATIQAAIDAASAGAVIELADGRYAGVGNKNLDFLGTALILRSESGDPDSCYVDCELAGRGLYFKSGEDTMTVVLGIGVRNGRLNGTQRGAGVACVGASPKLVDCRIIGNGGGIQGGGLYCENASPVLERTSLTGNASQFGGGIYAKGVSAPRLVGCTLSGNLADVDGGGLFSASLVQIHLQRTILSGNCADGEGDDAYLFSPSSDLALTCSLVDDSGVEGAGGLLHLDGSVYDDPRFCAAQSCVAAPTIAGDYRVRSNSPALAENSVCAAQIGVFGAGCGPLPTGACCLPSGGCAIQEQAVCLGLGGAYAGNGVPCEIAGCAAGGACCLPSGACIAATPVTCAGSGGDYLGNDTVCTPYPCPAIVVRPDGSGDYATIQDALDACAPGTTIELAAGVFVGPRNRDLDFRGKAITLRSQAATPDLCVIDCQGSGRGAYFANGEGADSRLEGVTIAAGRVTGSGRGAGIACVGSSPHIENCVIVGGRADADGGALYCLDSAPTLLGCTLAANRSARGGGLFVSGASTPQVERSVVWGNCADVIGDAIYLDSAGSQVTLTCTVVDTSEIEGAGSPIYGVEVVVDDPLFCSQPACETAPTSDGDFTVSAASVCLPQANGCGQRIGALGEGCQPVPGACCLGDDTCITAVIDACSAEGGQFLGEGVECPPNGCGANSGGVLLVHATPGLQYSLGGEYCGDAVITSCGTGVYEVAGADTVVFHVVAAFPNDGAPGLSGVSFGIDYDPAEFALIDGGSCGDFELAQASWPDSGAGTAVTWSVPRTATLTEVYWFVGVNLNPGSPTRFALIEHPEVGAFFADNQIPANLDPVVCLGSLGFDQPGAWCCVTVGVEDHGTASLPTAVALHAVTPNPVRDHAVIAFDLPAPSAFELGIYGVDGRRVRLLDAGSRPAGSYRVTWDRRSDHSAAVPAGVYWVRLSADARTEVRKLLIVR